MTLNQTRQNSQMSIILQYFGFKPNPNKCPKNLIESKVQKKTK